QSGHRGFRTSCLPFDPECDISAHSRCCAAGLLLLRQPVIVWPNGQSMKRREFIALAATMAATWPFAVRAQQSALPVIGFLEPTSLDKYAPFVEAFRNGLREVGFTEGHNIAIEYRWAEGQYARLPEMAAELVQHKVAVIVATGITAARAAKAATSTI